MSLELFNAAYKLVNDVLRVRDGEEVVITMDTGSDLHVAMAIAQASVINGGKPLIVLRNETPVVGKAMDRFIPVKTLSA
ncbi:MAG: hypothetical protein RQ877_05575, partial [Vulcanisaeta sp.]|nr:hypothetical protein [Vulcanisaeta sp.]